MAQFGLKLSATPGQAIVGTYYDEKGIEVTHLSAAWADTAYLLSASNAQAIGRLIMYEGAPPTAAGLAADFTSFNAQNYGSVIFDSIFDATNRKETWLFDRKAEFGRVLSSPGSTLVVVSLLPAIVGNPGAAAAVMVGSVLVQYRRRTINPIGV